MVTRARSVPWLVVAAVAGCAAHTPSTGSDEPTPAPAPTPVAGSEAPDPEGPVAEGAPRPAPPPRCDDPLDVWEGGRRTGAVCEERATERGLTVLDLGDDWTPIIFSEAPGEEGSQPYRPIYQALADERLDDLPEEVEPERFLELFGIFPTLRVLRERLAASEVHACHAAVDDSSLAALDFVIRPYSADIESQRRRIRQVRFLENRLERARRAAGVATLEELASEPRHRDDVELLQRRRVPVHAVIAMQQHLACDGLLPEGAPSALFSWRTSLALRDWQQKHMVSSPGLLDEVTREALQTDNLEAEFQALIRALRERVVSATGLIEDGSARGEWGTVLGRQLDGPDFRSLAGHDPLPNGAPDLISPATEAAARALGWTSPAEAIDALARLGETGSLKVAVRLPPLPVYHSSHMDLRAEIDRGDVWYSYPYSEDGNRRGQPVSRRPILTLFAKNGATEVPVLRWATTIGSWQPEIAPDGTVGLKYKESPVGRVIWRQVVAAPAWVPPPNTPAEDLVRRSRTGRWVPNYTILGPGFRSAYGLSLMMHHQPMSPGDDGEPRWLDEGIRTHGSVSYRSILRGHSHGCHRLFNHLAVRLSSFLLAHRNHERRGREPVNYGRSFEWEGQTLRVHLESRGYYYELTPPVDVDVLEGRVLGGVSRAIQTFQPLREDLVQRVLAEAAEDN